MRITICFILILLYLFANAALAHAVNVEQWGQFEVVLKGPASGNPFVEVELSATFIQGKQKVQVSGFYDGDGSYKIRFMPTSLGEWSYKTGSNRPELDGKTGQLTVVKPLPGNRGPVRVRNTFHFAYADGTAFFPIGTTCYAWTHQPAKIEEQTLVTL